MEGNKPWRLGIGGLISWYKTLNFSLPTHFLASSSLDEFQYCIILASKRKEIMKLFKIGNLFWLNPVHTTNRFSIEISWFYTLKTVPPSQSSVSCSPPRKVPQLGGLNFLVVRYLCAMHLTSSFVMSTRCQTVNNKYNLPFWAQNRQFYSGIIPKIALQSTNKKPQRFSGSVSPLVPPLPSITGTLLNMKVSVFISLFVPLYYRKAVRPPSPYIEYGSR